MSLTRRTFLKSASLFTVSSIAYVNGWSPNVKKQSIEEYLNKLLTDNDGVIDGKTFILTKPLEFYDCYGLLS